MEQLFNSEQYIELIKLVEQLLPKTVEEERDFERAKSLQKTVDLRFNDVKWIFDPYEIKELETAERNIAIMSFDDGSVESYVKEIIFSEEIQKREKLIVLLAHMEPLIYDAIGKIRERRDRLKNVMNQHFDGKESVTPVTFNSIYLVAITNVIFSNVDDYKCPIDRTIPFRNHILHRGIIGYSNSEIEASYQFLVQCIAIIMISFKRRKNEDFKQTIFSVDQRE